MTNTNEYTVTCPHEWKKELYGTGIWDEFSWSSGDKDKLTSWSFKVSTYGRRSEDVVPSTFKEFVYVSFEVFLTREVVKKLFRKPYNVWHVTMCKYAENEYSYPGRGLNTKELFSKWFWFEFATEKTALDAFKKADILITKIKKYLAKLDQDKQIWIKLCQKRQDAFEAEDRARKDSQSNN